MSAEQDSPAQVRLSYLPVNAAYVFTFGDAILQMGDAPRFFMDRREAAAAARACGLGVNRNGTLQTIEDES